MKPHLPILQEIKKRVHEVQPGARIILFGSFARGDQHEESDIDLLILVDAENVSHEDEKNITFPLYDLEIKTGQIISPMVRTKTEWEQIYRITPLYYNIQKEGIAL